MDEWIGSIVRSYYYYYRRNFANCEHSYFTAAYEVKAKNGMLILPLLHIKRFNVWPEAVNLTSELRA